ncbi:30S ribosomal protein S6 [Candidatus Aerophobetes bacterium]|nr:30S ribosomal protein S6 [Candidatus Aerophobetes bacterium]
MQLYEMVFALRPTVDEAGVKAIKGEIEAFITQNEGKVENITDIGKKKLAYEVEKEEEGYFVRVFFRINPEVVKQLEGKMRAKNEVIRLMIMKRKQVLPLEKTKQQEEERSKSHVSSQ